VYILIAKICYHANLRRHVSILDISYLIVISDPLEKQKWELNQILISLLAKIVSL